MSHITEVRDPLHGGIPVGAAELAILDHPLVQRLRHVRQLGFSDLAFPGATHHRYLHSIGVMHLAGRAFDSVMNDPRTPSLPTERRTELRRMVRAAALLHDSGHAPFSHASEFAMPAVGTLGVPVYAEHPELYPPGRQATHEDYTIKILTDSSLTPVIESDGGPPALAIAGLVDPRLPVDAAWYEAGGLDWRPFLQQLISSELDVDRMDYLARDSHFTGVHYGVFDVGWLMNSLATHVVEGQVFLALQERAIYAFDDFLIARYHMFLMVYFHSRSVAYEEMLKQHFSSDEGGYSIPSEVELFAGVDDLQLLQHLRGSQDEWARRIVDRREYKLLIERHGSHERVDLSGVLERLQAAGIPTLTAASRGVLSKYFDRRRDTPAQETLPLNGEARDNLAPTWPIWVLRQPYRGSSDRRASELEHSTDLFDRYAGQLRMRRIYVPPERVEESGRLIADIA